jgi:predicted enzyme related to lactoylglutathione lyase
MPNPIAFFEIVGPDGPALQRFYADAFGWTVDATKVPGYGYLNTGEPNALPGGIRQETVAPPERVLYIRVPDMPAALEKVKAAGGSVVLPPTRLPWVHFALFRDPAGNLTGLLAD